jgi:hypothetical protein
LFCLSGGGGKFLLGSWGSLAGFRSFLFERR